MSRGLSIQQAIDRLESLVVHLADDVQDNVEAAAFDAISIISTRVQKTGKDDTGSDFKDYTDPYKRYKANFRELNSRKEKRKDAKEAGKPAPGFRKQLPVPTGPKGRYKGYVDFNLTGRLWGAIGITIKELSGNASRMVVGARDANNEKKLAGNAKHRPALLRVSREETTIIQSDFQSNMYDSINKRLS